jgi:hypothetical protein
VKLKDLFDVIKKGNTETFTMKCIFIVIFKCIVCPTQHARVARETGIVYQVDYTKLRNMDICRVVVDDLKRGVRIYHDEKVNIAKVEACTVRKAQPKTAEGCVVLPLIVYLDSRKCRLSNNMTTTPRVSIFKNKRVYATSRVRVPGDVQAIGRHHLTMDGIERYGI